MKSIVIISMHITVVRSLGYTEVKHITTKSRIFAMASCAF
jgi:hypothetical protein